MIDDLEKKIYFRERKIKYKRINRYFLNYLFSDEVHLEKNKSKSTVILKFL